MRSDRDRQHSVYTASFSISSLSINYPLGDIKDIKLLLSNGPTGFGTASSSVLV